MKPENVKEFLDEQAALMNTADFIPDDPVQFPRQYTKLQDIEIVSFLVTTIAWGKRSMILRSAERMLEKLGESPYEYVMNGDYQRLGNRNIHRTFFEQDLKFMLQGFERFYRTYRSMDDFMATCKTADRTPQQLVETLSRFANEAAGGKNNTRCYSSNLKQSALKRVNLALRWLVRDDGIVDLGVWKSLKPGDLYIPLDIHVGNVARELGLLNRKQNDRKAVEELTAILRSFNPQDPVIYDFALFGIGVGGKGAFER
ncbi:MAG: TIGR02757 family protein [Tannerella sp.]|nr:TIGR02757 family protein [Tannerella sp.]